MTDLSFRLGFTIDVIRLSLFNFQKVEENFVKYFPTIKLKYSSIKVFTQIMCVCVCVCGVYIDIYFSFTTHY